MSKKYKTQDVRFCINCHLPIEDSKPRKGDTQVHKSFQTCFALLFAEIGKRDRMLLDASQGKTIDLRTIFYAEMQRQIQHIEEVQNQLESLRTFIIQYCQSSPSLAELKEISKQIEEEMEGKTEPKQQTLFEGEE